LGTKTRTWRRVNPAGSIFPGCPALPCKPRIEVQSNYRQRHEQSPERSRSAWQESLLPPRPRRKPQSDLEGSTIDQQPVPDADTQLGPRTVIAAAQTNDNRALLISDSSPFSTQYNQTFPQLGINETAFAMSLTDWVTRSDPTTKIIIDNAHYIPAMVNTPGLG